MKPPPRLAAFLLLFLCGLWRASWADGSLAPQAPPALAGEGPSFLTPLRPIHLIQFTDGMFEDDWIHELLSLAQVPVIDHHFHGNQNQTLEVTYHLDAVVVVPYELPPGPHMEFLETYQRQGVPFGVIHLSDEYYKAKRDVYNMTSCAFVFRNYFTPTLGPVWATVETFALGYKSGFWHGYEGRPPVEIPGSQRPYTWSFAGAAHLYNYDRVSVLHGFLGLQPYWYLLSHDFNSGLPVSSYRNISVHSKFVLCPPGFENVETFRLYEAMEAGAIPVTLSGSPSQPSYWEDLFGPYAPHPVPFIHHATWEGCKAEVIRLLANPLAYEMRRQEVMRFWSGYKARIAYRLREHIWALQQIMPALADS